MEETDVQLHLKKRARRRLVGAVAFVVLVAVALPMVMDHEPKPAVQDVEIRIPGQDEKPFAPKFAVEPAEKPPVKAPDPTPAVKSPPQPPEAASKVEPTLKLVEKTTEKAPEKSPAKSEKPPEKHVEKPIEKPLVKAPSDAEAKRAAAILAGKAVEPAAKGGDHVILIGAFANEANVKIIKSKLAELSIKTYTEPLDSPQGRKIRVRAGPFSSKEAADRALEKMKHIGVSGVVAAKQ